MLRISARLGGLGAGLLVAIASAVGATPAFATVTSSQITTPTGGFFQNNTNSSPPQQLHVEGTATTDDSFASDTVNILCVASQSSYVTLASGVTVNPDGSFAADVSYPTSSAFQAGSCDLKAIAPGSAGAAWANFHGPAINYGHATRYDEPTGSNVGTTYGYDVYTSSPGGGGKYESAGQCGISYSWLYPGGRGFYWDSYSTGPWDCNQYLWQNDGLYRSSSVVVGGHNAYLPYNANNINNGTSGTTGAGMPGITLSQSVDPSTGVLTITDAEGLAYCTDSGGNIVDAYQPSCDHWMPAPVKLVRTIVENHGGRQATITDQWQSTDGASHPIRLDYEEDFNYCYIQLPGESAPNPCAHTAGEEATVPATAPATIYAYSYPDTPSYGNPSGGLTYMDKPDRIVFNNAESLMRVYNRTVPASGSLNETTIYSSGMTQSQANTLAQAAQGATSAPHVAITSPAPNAVLSTATANVTGTASDDQPIDSITVNGVTTPVNPNGTWTQSVPLNPGPNTITAVATDNGGNSTTVSENVVYAPSAATCTVPKVSGMTLAQARSSLTLAGCTVGNTTVAPSDTVKKGSIVSQSAVAGSKVSAFVPVSMVVSSGRVGKARLATRTAHVHGNRLTIHVRCPVADGNACNGTAKVRTLTKLAGHRRTLGTHAFQAPAGKRRTVTFTLSKTDVARIRRARTVKALVYVVSRNASGRSVTTRYHLTIKR